MGFESRQAHFFRRLLFTATLTVTLTAFAFWSDSYSTQLSDSWRNWLGFSSLSLPELRWHQTLTSLVLTAGERQFVQSLLVLCISVGMCEWHFGSRPAIKVFFASHLIQDGVIRNLQTLAESSQRLSDGIKASRPEVDWRSCPAFETSWCTTTRVLISTLCFASSNTTCRG